MIYIFKYNSAFFIVPNAEKLDAAYADLQKRLSWNMDIVKKRTKLIHTISEMDCKIIRLN